MVAAWLAWMAGAWWVGRPRLPTLGWGPLDAAWLATGIAGGAWQMGRLRGIVGLSTLDASLFHGPEVGLWQRLTVDTGLPSHGHDLAVEAARWVGGIEGLLGLHAAMYAVFCMATYATLQAQRPGWMARFVWPFLIWSPVVLAQFTELRAYATYLAAIAVGTWCATLPDGRRFRAAAWWAFGMASLEVPIALTLVMGHTIASWARRQDASADPDSVGTGALGIATALLATGLTPTVLEALSVHTGARPNAWSLAEATVAQGMLLGAALVTLVATWVRGPRALAWLAAPPLAAVTILMALGNLYPLGRYVLFVAPLLLAVALRAGRTRSGDPLPAVILLVCVASALHWPPNLRPEALPKLTATSIYVVLPALGAMAGALATPAARSPWVGALRGGLWAFALLLGQRMLIDGHHERRSAGQARAQVAYVVARAQALPLCVTSPLGRMLLEVDAIRTQHGPSTPLQPRASQHPWTTTCPDEGVYLHLANSPPTPTGHTCAPDRTWRDTPPMWGIYRCEPR